MFGVNIHRAIKALFAGYVTAKFKFNNPNLPAINIFTLEDKTLNPIHCTEKQFLGNEIREWEKEVSHPVTNLAK